MDAFDHKDDTQERPPHEWLDKIQKDMIASVISQHPRDHRCHDETPSLLISIRNVLNNHNLDLEKMQYTMFRDEYIDNRAHHLGKNGQWLRRRFHHGPYNPAYTLRHLVEPPSVIHEYVDDVVGATEIEAYLKCSNLDVAFPIIVAAYHCLRITMNMKDYRSTIDVAYLSPKQQLCHVSTKVMKLPSDLNPIQSFHHIHPTSKVIHALYLQDEIYFKELLDLKVMVQPRSLKAMSMDHMTCPPWLQTHFQAFDSKFYISFNHVESYADALYEFLNGHEDDDDQEQRLHLPIQTLSDSEL